MKYELRYEVWRGGFCIAAFRYPDHAREWLAGKQKEDHAAYMHAHVEAVRT